MGFLRAKASNTAPDYTGLQLQTSVNTLPIPILWGQSKVSANVIWYGNFQVSGGSSGKGGVFKQSSDTVSYSADLIMALCEGPISGIAQIWKNQSVYTLASLGLTFFNGTTPQAVWGYLASTYPTQDLAYQGTAYVSAASYALGDSADVGNHNFEIVGLLAGTGVNGIDADPAQVINDFLTNPQYGLGFDAGSINYATLYGSGGDASLQTYCKAALISFSPALTDQETASSILTRWLQLLNCAAVWSGGQLKFIPYGDSNIAAGTNIATSVQLPIVAPAIQASGAAPPPQIVVCPASLFVSDQGVTYANSGVALAATETNPPTAAGTYCLSPNGTYLFSGHDESAVVQIAYTYAIPATYTPDLTPVYSLTDDDFVIAGDNKDPVQVSRVDPFSLPTIQRLEVSDRNNQYALLPVEARDQSQIEIYGPRVGSTITAHEICDIAIVAPTVAQLILQRQLYIRANFTFKLSWEYVLLEPMDIVEITDANLGLDAFPVRIVSVEEDEKGLLTIVGEELTAGVSSHVLYPIAPSAGLPQAHNVLPGSVNPPLIYEPPGQLSQALQVWFGVSGADPSVWGGCTVWVSADGSNYDPLGTVQGGARQGVLTGALPSVATTPSGPTADNTNTLAVSLAECDGELNSGTAADLAAMTTLCLVDNELIAYQIATLTGANVYNLTDLLRGCYNTQSAVAAHTIGAPFTRLDSAILKWTYPNALIGTTLHFKFTSFNIYGQAQQSLADVEAYAYTLTGTPTPGEINILAAALTQVGVTMTLTANWAADPLAATYVAEYSSDGGETYTAVPVGPALSLSVPGLGLTSVYLRVAGVNANDVYGPYAEPIVVTGALSYDTLFGGTPFSTVVGDINTALANVTAATNEIDAILAMRADIATVSSFANDDASVIANFLASYQAQAQTNFAAQIANVAGANVASVLSQTFTSITLTSAFASLENTVIGQVNANYAAWASQVAAQAGINSATATSITALETSVTDNYNTLTASIEDISSTVTVLLTSAAAMKTDSVTASYAVEADQAVINSFLTAFQAGQQAAAVNLSANSALAGVATTQASYASTTQAIATLSSVTLAQYGNALSQITEVSTAASAANAANAQQITTVSAQLGSTNANLASVTVALTATETNVSSLSASVTSLNASVGGSLGGGATIVSTLEAQATVNSSVASSVASLNSSVGSLNGSVSSISTTLESQASTLSAQATSIASLNASVGGSLGGGATIVNTLVAQATTNSSVAASISSLNSSVGGLSGSVSSINSTLTTQSSTLSTLAADVTSLQSSVGGINGSIASINSTLTTQSSTLSAVSADVTTLQATALQTSANVTMEFSTVAKPTGSYGAWALIITANGRASSAASMEVVANSDGYSYISFQADQFSIGSATTNTVPFQVNSDGSLSLNNVTRIGATIQSSGVGGNGQPYMTMNFGSSPSIVIDDGT